MLSSLRNGLREHSPSMPDTVALHCSIELKLQFLMKSTSRLQNSPARAADGANSAPSAIAAANVAAGIVITLNTAVVIWISFHLRWALYDPDGPWARVKRSKSRQIVARDRAPELAA